MIFAIESPRDPMSGRPSRRKWKAIPSCEEFSADTEYLLYCKILTELEEEITRIKKEMEEKFRPTSGESGPPQGASFERRLI